MSIVSSVNKPVGQFMSHTATKWFAKSLEKGLKEPAKYAAKMMVVSLISKDAINCAFYTYQSYNNEKIPEDKRKFVAALDLINGIINVGGQLLSFMLVDRFLTPMLQGKVYNGVIKNPKTGAMEQKYSNAILASDNLQKLTLEAIEENRSRIEGVGANVNILTKNIKEVTKDVVKKFGHGSSKGKDLTTGLAIIISSLATTALIKRTLTPLISTPLAGWFKDEFMEKKGKKSEPKPEKDMTPAMVNSTIPKVGSDEKALNKLV